MESEGAGERESGKKETFVKRLFIFIILPLSRSLALPLSRSLFI
jgi:hypothetical protein